MNESDAMAEQHPSCNVVLIAGFLGAGKTTLLKHILEWPGDLSSTAVLVNEFGQVGIDGELLQGFATDIVELTNGCICCTIKADLLKSVKEILGGFHPRRLFIEATGVADPFDVKDILRSPQLTKHIGSIAIITVVNGDLWEGREYFGPLFYNQIKAAALILFNKVDLLTKEHVPQCLSEIREINPSCSLVPTHHCQIDPEVLWKPSINTDQEPEFSTPFVNLKRKSAEDIGYVTFSYEDSAPFKRDCLQHFIETLPAELYRLKGFALLEDKSVFINHVGGRTEWVELDKKESTRLAFVGWQVSKNQVLENLKACLQLGLT
ncbi:MAG: CobW family GTP-binding protein [Desulfobacterales bacterium]